MLVPSQPGAHPSASLKSRPAEERYGSVWTRFEEPLLEAPAIPETNESDGGWEVACGQWFDVRCGLRSITENFRDSSHFAFVHRETFADVNPEVPAYTVERQGWRLVVVDPPDVRYPMVGRRRNQGSGFEVPASERRTGRGPATS